MEDFGSYFDNVDRVKHFSIEDKKFELHVTDPYGFWTIAFPKKEKQPENLKGQYTSFDAAEKAVRAYYNGLEIAARAKAS